MNIKYSRFYNGTEKTPFYGNGAGKKDAVAKQEFSTTNQHGSSIQAAKDVRPQYGDSVAVEFSKDGIEALVEGRKGSLLPDDQGTMQTAKAKNEAFQKEIQQIDNTLNDLPAYSGLYGADKAVAAALENCSRKEQGFVYDIIRQNFLIENSGSMTPEERQANISLGMKKAEYAAENMISEDSRESFLNAMESIAKLASAGKDDSSGTMDYGAAKGKYLGHGSGLVRTTDTVDMMRSMDQAAYEEYQKLGRNNDGGISALKYLTNWFVDSANKNPHMVDNYERKSEEYVEKNVKGQKLDTTFDGLKTGSKEEFLKGLKAFQKSNPDFLASMISRELASKYWGV